MINNDQPVRMPPTICAPSRESCLGDMPAQHSEGNPLESGEDTARALAGDVAKKFQAPSPLAVDEQPLGGSVERQTMLNDSTNLSGRVTPTGRAPCREKIWMAHLARFVKQIFECLERTLLILLKKNSLPS